MWLRSPQTEFILCFRKARDVYIGSCVTMGMSRCQFKEHIRYVFGHPTYKNLRSSLLQSWMKVTDEGRTVRRFRKRLPKHKRRSLAVDEEKSDDEEMSDCNVI